MRFISKLKPLHLIVLSVIVVSFLSSFIYVNADFFEFLLPKTKDNYVGVGTLTVPQGGTGATSFTVGECLKGNGTGAITTGACGGGGGGTDGNWVYTAATDSMTMNTSTTNVIMGTSTQNNVRARTSAGLNILSNNGTQIVNMGAGGGAGVSFANGVTAASYLRVGTTSPHSDAMIESRGTTADGSTGLFHGYDSLSNEVFSLQSNGYLGLATMTPDTKLVVQGGARFGNGTTTGSFTPNNDYLQISAGVGSSAYLLMNKPAATNSSIMAFTTGNNPLPNYQLAHNATNDFNIYNSATAFGINIASTSKMGIGNITTVPQSDLDLSSSGSTEFRITAPTGSAPQMKFIRGTSLDASTDFVLLNSGGTFIVRSSVSGTNRDLMQFNSTGFVGIGTSSPFTTLTASGSLMITGRIYDNTFSSGNYGDVLMSTSTGYRWVATSSLGIVSGGGTGDMTKAVYDPANIAEQLVGLTATQSLTNKTINSLTNYVDADALHEKVFNNSGGVLSTGTPVYSITWSAPNNAVEVGAARADTASAMPAICITEETIANGGTGSCRSAGILNNVNTNIWSEGTYLYVAPTGGLTATKPTAVNQLIQPIAIVKRQNANTGILNVFGIGLTATNPNAMTAVTLTVTGTTTLQDSLVDSYGSAGSLGMVLTNTGTSTRWLATSSLGLEPTISILPVSKGGTGSSTLGTNFLFKGNGTNPVLTSILYDNGTGIGIANTNPTVPLVVGDGGLTGGLFTGAAYGTSSAASVNQTWASTTKTMAGYSLSTNDGVRRRRVQFFLDDSNGVWGLMGNASSGGSGDFVIATNFANEKLRILNSSGNVGIGTSVPLFQLDVRNDANQVTARFGGINATAKYIDINNDDASTGDSGLRFTNNSAAKYTIGYDQSANNFAIAPAVLGTNNRFVIDSTGNVGIGTNTPGALFNVNGAILSDGSSPNVKISHASGTLQLAIAGGAGSQKPALVFTSPDGLSRSDISRRNGFLGIGTTNGSLSEPSPNFVIDNTGQIGIGTTVPTNTLTVQGSARFTGQVLDGFNLPGTAGQVLSSTATGTLWKTLSGGASPLTTKGDLYTFTTVDARLPAGTDGQALVASSTASTGLEWKTLAGSGTINTGSVGQFPYYTGDTTLSATSTMFLSTSGDIGIGTTTPQTNFVVDGGDRPVNDGFANFTAKGVYGFTKFTRSDAATTEFRIWPYTGNGNIYLQHDTSVVFSALNVTTPQLSINPTGLVGIGTTTQVSTLSVVQNDSNNIVDFIGSTSVSMLRIDGSGNLNMGSVFKVTQAGTAYIGDPGFETSGINVGGTTYNSELMLSDFGNVKSTNELVHVHSTVYGPTITGARSNSNTSSHATTTAGQDTLLLEGTGVTSVIGNTPTYNRTGQIRFALSAYGTISGGSSPGDLFFLTTTDGTTTPSIKFQIDNYGTLAMGSNRFFLFELTTSTSTSYGFYGDGKRVLSGDKYLGEGSSTAVVKMQELNMPDSLAGAATAATNIFFTDDISRYFACGTGGAGTCYLRNKTFAGAVQVYGGSGGTTAQSLNGATFNAVVTFKGAVTYEGYHFIMASSSIPVNTLIIKRAVSSSTNDISSSNAWATSTISGWSPLVSVIGLVGVSDNTLWVASSTTVLVPLSIDNTTNTLTAGSPVTISGAAMSINNTRVNYTGIYAGFGSAPFNRKYSLSGVSLNKGLLVGAPATTPDIFATPYSFYAVSGSSAAITTRQTGY